MINSTRTLIIKEYIEDFNLRNISEQKEKEI